MGNSKFFTKVKNTMVFNGKKLEIFIPTRYEMHDCLIIEDSIKTIGFFDMVINGSIKSGFKLAAIVEIEPSEIEQVTKGTQTFLKLTLYQGDTFLASTTYVENSKLTYVLFYEMTYSGNYPDFTKPEDLVTIYDYITTTTGMVFHTNHAILEMIASQLTRDSSDIATLFRHTDMNRKPKVMGLHSIAQIATSTTGKINGAWMKQGMHSVLAGDASQENSDIEDLLRSNT
jgi:hypothetical protein